MQQPPSDRSDKNPYATPSAWPRAPQQTFHLRVPKAPPGTQAAQPAPKPAAPPPRPARPSSILTGSALPVGYTAPQRPPEVEVEAVAPEPLVEAGAPEPEPDVAPAPPFIAPPEAPFAAPPRKARREKSRAPLFIGAAAAVAILMGGAAWLMLREPDAAPATVTEYAPAASAPAVREPVITPPAWAGIVAEPAAEEPDLRGAAEPVQTAAVSQSATRTTRSAATATLPTGPQPYSGSATPAPSVAVQPLEIPRPPAPPPPASAPGPQTPVADPNAPLTTRDPTSGD